MFDGTCSTLSNKAARPLTWQSEHAEHLQQVQLFLSQPYAGEECTWKNIFASQPPRRAVLDCCFQKHP